MDAFVTDNGPNIDVYLNRNQVDVALQLQAEVAVATPNQPVQYTIVYTNTGLQLATNVVISSLLHSDLIPITYTYSGPTITATDHISFVWQVADLAPGEGGIITITALIEPDLMQTIPSSGYQVVNTAVVATHDVDTQPSNNASNSVVIDVVKPPPLTYHEIATDFDDAQDVATADINGDGNLDIIGANSNGHVIWWHNELAVGGISWIPHPVTPTLNGIVAIDVADINGDGHIDILAATPETDTVIWWQNDGTGINWLPHIVANDFLKAYDVMAADINSDGKVDIVAAGYNGVAWWENDGAMVGGLAHSPVDNITEATTLFVADVNQDGKVDLLSASPTGIYWWSNNTGDGLTWTKHLVVDNLPHVTQIHAAPINYNDSYVDIVASVSDGSAPGLFWWRNTDGIGTAWHLETPLIERNGVRAVYVANLNVDHKDDPYLDIVAAVDNKVMWWENKNGTGTSWEDRIAPAYFNGATAVHVDDIDNDGRLDIIGAANGAGLIACWGNRAIGDSAIILSQSWIGTSTAVYDGEIANLDGDGDVDVIGASSQGLTWWQNEPTSNSWFTQTIDNNATDLRAITSADLDGDGDVDMLGASTAPPLNLNGGQGNSSALTWWRNDSNGNSWVTSAIDLNIADINTLDTADLDGDGDSDIIASAGSPTNKVMWWENVAGDATVWTPHTISIIFTDAEAIRIADLDHDGDIDIVGASLNNGVVWWENVVGDASSWQSHLIDDTVLGVTDVEVWDVDENGRLDIIATVRDENAIKWWSNSDSFNWTAHEITNEFIDGDSLYVADIDGDGDVDILGASRDNDQVAWWEQAGENLWHYHLVDDRFRSATWVATANIDGDGDLDIVAAAYNEGLAWWQNQGGQFGLNTIPTSGPLLVSGVTDDLLHIRVTHYGAVEDNDLAVTSLALLWESSIDTPLTSDEAAQLFDEVAVYLDDGSGFFEAHRDTAVTVTSTVVLSNGVQLFTFAEDDPAMRVAVGTPRIYFVVATLAADAYLQTPNQFRVTHLTASENRSTSQAIDAVFGYTLTAAYTPDVSSPMVKAVDALPIQLIAESGRASIQLDWNPTNDPAIKQYRVWRAVSETHIFTPVVTLNRTFYFDVDTTLEAETNYCYYIEALGSDEQVVLTSNTVCTTFGLVHLWVPSVRGKPGQAAIIPVNIRNAQGLAIGASDIWFDYDSRVLDVVDVQHTSLTRGYTWGYNIVSTDVYSRVRIGLVDVTPTPLYGDGSLFWLYVRVTDTVGITSPLDLKEFIFGVGGSTIHTTDNLTDSIPLTLQDGLLEVTFPYVLGDLNGNGVTCQAPDAAMALMIVTRRLIPTPEQVAAGDVNGNSRIDSGDAAMLLYCMSKGHLPVPRYGNNLMDKPTRGQENSIVVVSLSEAASTVGSRVQANLTISNAIGLAGGEIIIAYDSEAIANVNSVTPTGIGANFDVSFEDDGAGLLRVALASTTAVTGTGNLLAIEWQLAATLTGTPIPLTLADVQLHDALGRNFATSELQYEVVWEDGVVCGGATTVAPYLNIYQQGEQIHLIWDDNPANTNSYEVWRSHIPYSGYSWLADVSQPNFVHNRLGKANYYTVHSTNRCGETAVSNKVGQFTFVIE